MPKHAILNGDCLISRHIQIFAGFPLSSPQARARSRTSDAFLITLTAVALAVFSGPCQAGEWTLQGNASTTGIYDDNVRLRQSGAEDTYGLIVRPGLDLRGTGEGWNLGLLNHLAVARYENSDFDAENFGSVLDGEFRNEELIFNMEGLFSRRTAIELLDNDTDDFDNDGYKFTAAFAPSWRAFLGTEHFLDLGFGAQAIDYRKTDRFEDYQTYDANLGIGLQYSERDEITAGLVYSRNESDDESEADFYGLALGWRQNMSTSFDWFFNGGPRYIETKVKRAKNGQRQTDTDSSYGFFFDAGFSYDVNDRTRVRLNAGRSVDGSGGGGVIEKTLARVIVNYRISKHWTTGLAAVFRFNQDPNDDNSSRERDFLRVQPRLAWSFVPNWVLSASYRFRTLDRNNFDRAYSNAALLSLTYSTPKVGFSD